MSLPRSENAFFCSCVVREQDFGASASSVEPQSRLFYLARKPAPFSPTAHLKDCRLMLIPWNQDVCCLDLEHPSKSRALLPPGSSSGERGYPVTKQNSLCPVFEVGAIVRLSRRESGTEVKVSARKLRLRVARSRQFGFLTAALVAFAIAAAICGPEISIDGKTG